MNSMVNLSMVMLVITRGYEVLYAGDEVESNIELVLKLNSSLLS